MPVRELGVDAAVLFADIMLPLEPMGVGLRIEPEVGPIIERPIRSAADVAALRPFDPAEVSFTLDAIRLVRRELDGRAGVIGFSGAPFTLACYLIEGRPSRDYAIGQGVHVPRAGGLARPDGAPVDDGRRLSPGPGRRRRRGRPGLRQLGRRPRPGRLREPSSSPTCGGSSTGSTACRRSTSGRARRPCSSSWPRPAATSSASTTGSRWPTPGGGSGYDRGIQGNLDAARVLAGWEATEAGARASSPRRTAVPATSSTSATACCRETDTDLLRRLVDFVHEQTARTGGRRRGCRVSRSGSPGACSS